MVQLPINIWDSLEVRNVDWQQENTTLTIRVSLLSIICSIMISLPKSVVRYESRFVTLLSSSTITTHPFFFNEIYFALQIITFYLFKRADYQILHSV